MLDVSALEERVLKEIVEKGLMRSGETVLAAVSGGSDSMALLALLLALRERLGICLEAAHFEHGIRAERSRQDMRFVCEVCARWGVVCHTGTGDVPQLARTWKCSLEDAARRARYVFLDETALRCGATKIALGHQMEDQAETLLLHLTRGCGLEGLAAMRPLQGNRVRPLLGVHRQELRLYLTAREILWREDETNGEPCCARNALRLGVMPQLRRINPRVEEALCRAAAHAAEAAKLLRAQAEERLCGRWRRTPYGAFWLTERMDADAVRLLAEKAGAPALDEAQTARACALSPGEETALAGGWRALRTARRLHLIARVARYEAGGTPFSCTLCAPGETGDGMRCQVFDASQLAGAAFRARRDGDVFSLFNLQGEQKLKKTMQDAKIDRPFRDLLPVLARGNRVLWVVGLKPSGDAAVTERTRQAVMVRYTGDLPWEIV